MQGEATTDTDGVVRSVRESVVIENDADIGEDAIAFRSGKILRYSAHDRLPNRDNVQYAKYGCDISTHANGRPGPEPSAYGCRRYRQYETTVL